MEELTFQKPETEAELMQVFAANEQVCVYDATQKEDVVGRILSIERSDEPHCFDLKVKRHWVHGVLRRKNTVVHWKPTELLKLDENETPVEAEA